MRLEPAHQKWKVPGCDILREKVCVGLFTKSCIAIRTL